MATVHHIPRRQSSAAPSLDQHVDTNFDLDWHSGGRSHDRWCGFLRAVGVPLAAHGEIPLAGFAQITLIAALVSGLLLAVLNRRSSDPVGGSSRLRWPSPQSRAHPGGIRRHDRRQGRSR